MGVCAFVCDRSKKRQRRKRVGGQFRDGDILIGNDLFCRETPFDRSQLDVSDVDLSAVDFDLKLLFLAIADGLTELFERHKSRREIVFQVGKQSKFDLFNHISGSEEQGICLAFDFDPLVRLD